MELNQSTTHPNVLEKYEVYNAMASDYFHVIMLVVYFWAGTAGAVFTYFALLTLEALDAPAYVTADDLFGLSDNV